MTFEEIKADRPEVLAYISQAAVEIAKEKQFIPENEAAMEEWLLSNREAIAHRAITRQWDLLSKIHKHGVKDKVVSIMSVKVWTEINKQKLISDERKALNNILA